MKLLTNNCNDNNDSKCNFLKNALHNVDRNRSSPCLLWLRIVSSSISVINNTSTLSASASSSESNIYSSNNVINDDNYDSDDAINDNSNNDNSSDDNYNIDIEHYNCM